MGKRSETAQLSPSSSRSDKPGREKTSTADRGPVDLYYYDGLARQDHLVRLTVNCSEFYERPRDEDLGCNSIERQFVA